MADKSAEVMHDSAPMDIPRWCWDYEVDRWHFSARTSDSLRNAGILHLRDLQGLSIEALARYPGFGLESLKEVAEAVARLREPTRADGGARKAASRSAADPTSSSAAEDRYREWARVNRSNLRFWIGPGAFSRTLPDIGLSEESVKKLVASGITSPAPLHGLAIVDVAINFELSPADAAPIVLELSNNPHVVIAANRPDSNSPPDEALMARIEWLRSELHLLPRPGVRARIALDHIGLPPFLRERLALAGFHHCDAVARWFDSAIADCPLSPSEQENLLRRIWLLWSDASVGRVLEQGYFQHDVSAERLCVARAHAVMAAHTIDEELGALLTGLTDRVRQMVALRWGLGGNRPLSMEEIGTRFGVSRERVRQLTSGEQSKLGFSRLPLPLASMAVAMLASAGGALGTTDFVQLLRQRGLIDADETLISLREAEEADVVQVGLRFSDRYRLWLTADAERRLVKEGGARPMVEKLIEAWTKERDAVGGASFERVGAVAPFGLRHALELLDHYEDAGISVENESVLAKGGDLPTAIAVTLKSLAFARHVQLSGVLGYLREVKRLDVAESVLRDVISACGDLVISSDDWISLAEGVDATRVLSPGERAILAVMQREEGIVLHSDLTETMQQRGSSAQVAHQILALPCFIRYDRGIYAVRGKHVSPQQLELLKARQRDLKKAKQE